jgi:hypothetical protein
MMNVRSRPYVWWGLWTLLGLLMAVQVFRMRGAESLVRQGNGTLAASIRPQNGQGRALHAASLLSRGDARGARLESLAAIRKTPLVATGVRTLARAQDAIGGPGSGEQAWQAASLLGWRDPPTQLWAMLRALSNRQFEIFAMRADALMRGRAPGEDATLLLRQLMLDSRPRQTLVQRLALNPNWRPEFFRPNKPLKGPALEGTVLLLRDIGAAGVRVSRSELLMPSMGLIRAGREAEAIDLDRRFVRRLPDQGSVIDDGGFERRDTDYLHNVSAFDWRISGNAAALDESEGRGSMAIAAGGRQPDAVERFVALAPAHYQLSYAIRGDTEAGNSVAITVHCRGQVVGSSVKTPLGSAGWEARGFQFVIPASCPIARITIGAAQGAETVDALIDNVAIKPV